MVLRGTRLVGLVCAARGKVVGLAHGGQRMAAAREVNVACDWPANGGLHKILMLSKTYILSKGLASGTVLQKRLVRSFLAPANMP
jgi:hypothetical protein